MCVSPGFRNYTCGFVIAYLLEHPKLADVPTAKHSIISISIFYVLDISNLFPFKLFQKVLPCSHFHTDFKDMRVHGTMTKLELVMFVLKVLLNRKPHGSDNYEIAQST